MFTVMKKAAAKTAKRAKSLLLSPAARRHALVGQERLWKMKRDFQAKFLIGHGLRPSDYLLDFGCGTLRGGIPLIRYLDAGHYYGIEVRTEVLDEALRELDESGLQHKQPVLVSDPSALDLKERFTFAWAFSVLFHLRDEILDETVSLVANSLGKGGVFYANVNIGDAPEGHWADFPVVHRSLDFYQTAASRNQLRLRSLGTLEELGHHSGDPSHDKQIMLEFRKAV
jgi:SAM-dependent methyltransferase